MIINPEIDRIISEINKIRDSVGKTLFISLEDNIGKDTILREIADNFKDFYIIDYVVDTESFSAYEMIDTMKPEQLSIGIDDIFLLTRDGKVLLYVSQKDRKIDSSRVIKLLSIIQDWIKTSFGREKERELERFDYGKKKVLVEHGEHIYIIFVTDVDIPEIRADMRKILTMYEQLSVTDRKSMETFKSEIKRILLKRYTRNRNIESFISYISELAMNKPTLIILKPKDTIGWNIQTDIEKIADNILKKRIGMIICYEDKLNIDTIARRLEIRGRATWIKYQFRQKTARDYGISLISPYLVVRIPRNRVVNATNTDRYLITQKIKSMSIERLRKQVKTVFIVSETDYKEMSMTTFLKRLISVTPINLAVDTISRSIKSGGIY